MFNLTIEEMNELIHLQEEYGLKIDVYVNDPLHKYIELVLYKDGWTNKIIRCLNLYDDIKISIVASIKSEIEDFLKEVHGCEWIESDTENKPVRIPEGTYELIDNVMKNKDRSVTIYATDNNVMISVYPYPEDEDIIDVEIEKGD